MKNFKYKKLNKEIIINGIGLHSGEKVSLKLNAAHRNAGLFFINSNKDLGVIKVSPKNVSQTLNAVTLSNGKWQVQTVEHLLSALYTLEIYDLIIELSGNEIPILDGSGIAFYEQIKDHVIIEENEVINPIKLKEAISIIEKDKYLIALPSDTFTVQYKIDFKHPLLSNKTFNIDLTKNDNIVKEILPARTFGFLKDVEMMKEKGLIKGATIENAIVLDENGYLNESLRFEDECIRHKVLDLIGDLYLLGRPLLAQIFANKAGHDLDVKMTLKILEQINS